VALTATKAAYRGAKHTFVAIDMPFMSYQVSPEAVLENAVLIMKETGCQAVKHAFPIPAFVGPYARVDLGVSLCIFLPYFYAKYLYINVYLYIFAYLYRHPAYVRTAFDVYANMKTHLLKFQKPANSVISGYLAFSNATHST
jgi:hypothetical protein